MINLQEIRQAGLADFKKNRNTCIGIGLLLMIAEGTWFTFRIPFASMIEIAIVLFFILCIFNALRVGCVRFFLTNTETQAKPSELKIAVSRNCYQILAAMIMMDIKIFLWSLLFVIPGIMKSYSYRLVPYLLAENPKVGYKEILQESEELMYGHRMELLLLDLSFLGWAILGKLTLGIVDLIWTAPYHACAEAEFYRAVVREEENIWDV